MTINYRLKQGGLRLKTLTAIAAIGIALSGCAKNETADCETSLDNREFTSVSENVGCSDYQRASAYLGRAGFLFENFLADGASNNYRHALGIPDSATSYDTWDGKSYYDNALQLSGDATGDEYEGEERTSDLVEIHYFGSLAALMAQTYVELDGDADGTVSEEEKNDFSKINPSDADDYGTNDISASTYLQMTLTTGEVVLLDTSSTTNNCIVETDSSGTGFLNGTPGVTIGTAPCDIITATASGTCAIVSKVDSVAKMFTESIIAGEGITDLTTGFVGGIANMDRDLTSLNMPADSDLRKSLNDFKTKMDNGGSCESETITSVNKLLSLVAVSQPTEITSGGYGNTNLISLTALASSSDGDTTAPATGDLTCTNALDLQAKLVFKHPDGKYYPYYKTTATTDPSDVGTGVDTTFTSLTNIQLDKDGNQLENTEGDEKVSFKELLCMQ